jgi:hypothetical protein
LIPDVENQTSFDSASSQYTAQVSRLVENLYEKGQNSGYLTRQEVLYLGVSGNLCTFLEQQGATQDVDSDQCAS